MRTLCLALTLLAAVHADAQTRTRPEPPNRGPGSEPAAPEEVPEFFGEPVVSKRVAFVIDVSGSMATALNGPPSLRASAMRRGKRRPRPGVETRLDRVKTELLAVIEALPPEAKFNVHWFSTAVGTWRSELTAASADSKAQAKLRVQALAPDGATNLYDALAGALSDREVDTVYLLSDGQPNRGRYTATRQILAGVRAQLGGRKVTIHTVSVGPRLGLLESLAKQFGGRYRPH